MSDSLTVVAEGLVMGEVLLRGDRPSFRYEPDWQASEIAFPLSLSMPLIVREHGHRVVEAFLWVCCLTMTLCSAAGAGDFGFRHAIPFV